MDKLKPYAPYRQWTNQDHPAIEYEYGKPIVYTPEGRCEINFGDYIIGPDARNDYWVVPEDIFVKKYGTIC